ncbi:MAG TPA: GIY-YIG nuclease family protein [Kofleriaceae bacterium]|nr:GIY-YIG nuclease family protein [Kofleriaceae bacterium]
MPRWTVYLLECGDGSLYTGVAIDVARRLEEHNRGAGARYTRGRGPLRVVATSRPLAKRAAFRLEYQVKQLRPRDKPAAVRDTHRGSRGATRKKKSGVM